MNTSFVFNRGEIPRFARNDGLRVFIRTPKDRDISAKQVFDLAGRHPETSPGAALLEAPMRFHPFSSFFGEALTAIVALGGFLLFAAVAPAKANAWDDCNRRVAYTEWRYHEAREHSGPYSSAARHWAHEHHEALERCARYERDHHGDWDRR